MAFAGVDWAPTWYRDGLAPAAPTVPTAAQPAAAQPAAAQPAAAQPAAAQPAPPPVRPYTVIGGCRLRGQDLETVDTVLAPTPNDAAIAVEDAPHHANRQWDSEFEVLEAGPFQDYKSLYTVTPVYHTLGKRKRGGAPPPECESGQCGCETCGGTCYEDNGDHCEDCVCGATGSCEWCVICDEVHR